MSDDLRPYILIAASLGIFGVLWFLGAMFHREAVKQELRERCCEPLHIWWQPFAYWAIGWGWGTPFRVVYRDMEGRLHKAYCCVYKDLAGSPFGPRLVEWIQDEVIIDV